MGDYHILIKKIDAFARKYYLNQMIRGGLIVLSVFLTVFLIFNYLEFKYYFPPTVRTTLFYGFVTGLVGSLAGFVLWPMTKYFKLGSRIDHKQCAQIIGNHFGEIEDKLLNILDLHDQAQQSSDTSLLTASIDQKANQIKLVPFQRAVDLSENKKYLKFAFLPLLLLFVLLIKMPTFLSSSTYRYVKHNQEFEREAPFQFVFEPSEERVFQYADISIPLKVRGDFLPEGVDILVNGYRYRMNAIGLDSFLYDIKNVQGDLEIQFEANGFLSQTYQIASVGRPRIRQFTTTLDYPAYTKKKDEKLTNVGNIIVPQGTRITWNIGAEHVDFVQLRPFEDRAYKSDLQVSHTARAAISYALHFGVDEYEIYDSVQYEIAVIPDRSPTISVEVFEDTAAQERRKNAMTYFVGEVGDDYGITDVSSVLKVYDTESDQLVRTDSASIFDRLENNSLFKHKASSESLGLASGQYGELYFVVTDNDAVNGRKKAQSQTFSFDKPSLEMLRESEEIAEEDMLSKAKSLNQKQEALKKAAEELKHKLLQEKNISWQHEKQLEELRKQQKEISSEAEDLRNTFEELKDHQKELQQEKEQPSSEKELEKSLEELIEKTEKDKMEELLEKIQELFKKQKREEAINELNQTQELSEQKEMDYERLLELYKKLEVENDLQEQIDKLQELAKEQQKLSESEQADSEKQEKLNEEFEKLEKELNDLKKKNEDLKRPMSIPENKADQQEIKMNMDDALKNSKPEGNQSERKKSQEKAADQMEEMAEQMQNAMQSGQEEQAKEDMEMIRQLLENLVTLSFDQEDVFEKTNVYGDRSAAYRKLVQKQHEISLDWKLVKDTLTELSLRQPSIATYISENISEVDRSLSKTVDFLEDRKKSMATVQERNAMTHLNDLAVMLDESLQNLQKQMAQSSKPSAMCNNPKPSNKPGGKPGIKPGDKLSEGQKQLSQEMKDKLEEYRKSGKEGGSSKDFAQMAAQQSAMRKALEEKAKSLQEKGKGSKQLQDLAQEMDKIETDLVNKKLTNEMLKRQQDIITRLLEAENAEREQDWDDKRKSEAASQNPYDYPEALDKYLRNRRNEKVEYRTIPAELRPFYQRLVETYYEHFKS